MRYAVCMTDLVTVALFADRIEAELARGALDAAGIYAVIAADDAGQQNPGLDFSRGVGVFVRPEDVAAAKGVLHNATGRSGGE
jgi:hypothetical protein